MIGIHMKAYHFIFIAFCTISQALAQNSRESERSEQILELYNQQIRQFTGLRGCGHAIDGFTSFAKQTERVSLDALLQVSSEEEIEIGQMMFEKIKKEQSVLTSHWSLPKIEELFNRLIPFSERKDLEFKIHLIDSDQVNAFSHLGGHVYINTGLVDFVDSMDELAFIVGHEIAHVDKLHSLRKTKKLMMASSVGNMIRLEELTTFALSVNMFLSAPFDQIDEYEADSHGYEIAKNGGYQTEKFADFFTKMSKSENRNLLNKFLSTHPFPSDRKKCLNELDQ